MIIIEDCGQKENQHKIKNEYWKEKQVEVVRLPLPTGDYCLVNEKIQDVINRKRNRNLEVKKMDFLGCYNIAVDTKMDISELYCNLIQSHDRFRDELLLAQNNNIKLYILIENKHDIRRIEDLVFWDNPRVFIWIAEIKKAFIDMQKKWYSDSNAIKFLENRGHPIPNSCGEFKKEYFKLLKTISVDEILNYFKTKRVSAYLKDNKIKIRKKPVDNNSLIKTMQSMEAKYGVTFLFCTPEDSGRMIIKLLTEQESS